MFEPELAHLAEFGYAGLTVSMRGTGESEGNAGLYNLHARDGYDAVEWMATQDWCDGRVGMIGASLLGITQWLIAKALPPHLEAFVPVSSCADCYWYGWYQGGMSIGPGRQARGEPEYPAAQRHPDSDSWWRRRTATHADLRAIAREGIGVLVLDGLEDYFLPGAVEGYRRIAAAGGQAKLVLPSLPHFPSGDYGVGMLPYDKFTYQLLWFDHYLKGIDNGIEDEPSVLVYVEGANQWRFEEAWPIPDTRHTRLHLRANKSGSIKSRNDGSLMSTRPSPREPAVTYPYSPETGPFLVTGYDQNTGRPKQDQAADQKQVLTWTSPPLEMPTEVTGSPKLHFWSSATARDTDFVVEVSDVAPPNENGNSTSTLVTVGYLNAPHSFSRSDPRLLRPGRPYPFDIRLWPMSYVFEPGHRIRVSLAGGVKVGDDQGAPQGPGLNPNPATVTVYQDADRPGYLDLPIIGTARLPNERATGRRKGPR